jgi:VCBS repeat-containing protein
VLAISEVNGNALFPFGTPVTLASGAQITVETDGSYIYDPAGGFQALREGQTALDTINFTVADGNGGTDTAQLRVTVTGVNDAPDAVDDAFTVGEAGLLDTANVLGNDTDADTADLPSVVAVNGQVADVGSQITLSSGALLTLNGSGGFVYDPNGQFDALQTGDTATDSFTYTSEDGFSAQDTATVTITIEGNSSTPVANADAATTDEDSDTTLDVLLNDTDPDGDTLAVTGIDGQPATVGQPVALASGALATLNADGTITYDPNGRFDDQDQGDITTDSFTYTVDDGNNGTATGTATVTIDGVNDAPDARDDARSVGESGTVTIDLLANNGFGVDSDPDADAVLNVDRIQGQNVAIGTAVTLASGLIVTKTAAGTVEVDTDGQFEGLGAGESVIRTFAYRLNDGLGGTDSAIVRVTVNGENDDPEAEDDGFNVAVDGALAGNVLGDNGNGPDSDPDTNDTLGVIEVNGSAAGLGGLTLPSGAILTLNADGSFTYDQNGQFSGLGAGQTATDSFTYTIDDGNGGTDTATVSITIGGNNLPPVAADDPVTTDEDTALAAIAVLANDTDPNTADTLAISAIDTTGTLGTVTDNGDGTIAYDPAGQFEALGLGEQATDTFTYTVSDGNGGFDTATVTVTIDGVNDAPVANDDPVTTDEDTALAAIAVLANDSDVDTTDTLAISAIDTTGTLGTVTDNGDGTIGYDPNGQFEALGAGDTATDTFTYTASDGNGGFDTATVTVTIDGVNDAPVVTSSASATVLEGQSGVLYTATADDPEGDTVTYALQGVSPAILAIDANTGDLTFVGGGPDVASLPDDTDPTIAQGRGSTDFVFDILATDGDLTDTFQFTLTVQADSDGDGVADIADNAIFAANTDQRDTDGDFYGNVIDADYDQDLDVDFLDFSAFSARFGTTDPDADFDADGDVDFLDFSAFSSLFGTSLDGQSFIDYA